jgi:hypothetical protein
MIPSTKENSQLLTRLAAIVAVLTVLGAAWPVLFNEGSAAGKFLVRTHQIKAADDGGFEAAMEAHLYGETVEVTTNRTESDLASTAADVSRIRQLDRAVSMLCLLLTVALPFGYQKWPKLSWLYLLPAIWLLVNAHAIAINGGKTFSELAVPAHATRWGMFLALALLSLRNAQNDRIANWILRIGCALTFATHGWEAIQLNPAFQDLLYVTCGHIDIALTESGCHGLLRIIGAMDLVLAISVVAVHSRPLLLWMACWGLITAASRPIALGLDAWPEFAMRLPNSAAPLLVLFIGLPAAFSIFSPKTTKQPEPNTS